MSFIYRFLHMCACIVPYSEVPSFHTHKTGIEVAPPASQSVGSYIPQPILNTVSDPMHSLQVHSIGKQQLFKSVYRWY